MARGSAANVFKVVLLGDMYVGKTSLLVRFVDGTWERTMDQTIGVTFLKSVIKVANEDVTLQLWDTPGQDRYAAANVITIRDADCCVIVFDVSDPEGPSSKIVQDIINRYKSACGRTGTFVVIVGNKCDLISSTAQDQELQKLEDQHNDFRLKSFLTSAKTGEGVNEVFQFVGATLLERSSVRMTQHTEPGIDIGQPIPKKSGCC
jgi:small GTP-binding protein